MSHQPQASLSLVMRQGPQPGQLFKIDRDVITLGRAQGNDIVISDEEVSRYHARLTRQGDSWILEDMGSRNGTFVDGVRITGPVQLTAGNQIVLGIDISFVVESSVLAADETLHAQQSTPDETLPPSSPQSLSSTIPSAPIKAGPKARKSGANLYILSVAALVVMLLLACAALLAYFYVNPPQPSAAAELATGFGPDIALQDPAPGEQVGVGESILVFAIARDQAKVTRMELWVDDQLVVQQDSPDPDGVTPLSLMYSLAASRPGTYALRIRAYNRFGGMNKSPTLYVTVTGESRPATAQYIVQPGDTQETITQMMSTTVDAILKENPGMGKVSLPGQIVVVPVAAAPYSPPQAGVQPAGAGWSGGAQATPQATAPSPQPKAGKAPDAPPDGAGLQPKSGKLPDKRDAQNPPQGAVGAPTLDAQAGDCTATLNWAAVPLAAKYVVYSQVSPSSSWQLVAELKADQLTHEVKELKPGAYFYKVRANTTVGKWAESAPKKVIIAPSAKCIPRGEYKLVHFQPLKLEPVDPKYKLGALFVTLGGVTGRKIPSAQGEPYPLPDWSNKKIEEVWPAPMSIYLNPDEPLRLEVTGEGWEAPGKKPQTLKSFEQTHAAGEIGPEKNLTGGNGQFKLTYRLWLEDTRWTGKGTTDQIKPPPELRLAIKDVDVQDKLKSKEIYACHQGCDPAGGHVLLWDFKGDENAIEGYIVYRGYSCPGLDGQMRAPQVLGKQYQGLNIPAKSEPVGCAARYQVSAFGPAGESAPSNEVTVSTASAVSRVKVTFKDLTLSRLTLAEVYLQANEYKRWTKQAVIPSGTSDLSAWYFDDRKGNNTLAVSLGEGETLQVSVQAGACQLGPKPVDATKSGVYTLEQAGADKCSATVEVGILDALPAGQVARPQADVGVMYPYLVGKDVFVRLDSLGPDALPSNRVELTSYWLTPGAPDKPLTPKQTVTRWWSPAATDMEVKVGNIDDLGQQDPKTVPLYIGVQSLDFDDPYQGNNVWQGEIPDMLPLAGGLPHLTAGGRPDGEVCSKDEECGQGSYCVDGKRCASLAAKEGNVLEGGYCHSDKHCASGICLCQKGQKGERCNWWDESTLDLASVGLIGVCIKSRQNGAPCSDGNDCDSSSCADAKDGIKRCAPIDGTGQPGEYCHHGNHCISGYCDCETNGGPCPWGVGTCGAKLDNGRGCYLPEQCKSGHCADTSLSSQSLITLPGRCAPKDGTGQPGDYCHHENHCQVGYCNCEFEGGLAGEICKNWRDYNTAWHPTCTAMKIGQTCSYDKQCESGHCAGVTSSQYGKCAPKKGIGEEGDYCIGDEQCASGMCECPKGSSGDPCSGWEKFTSSNHGVCRAPQPIGGLCSVDEQCASGKCDGGAQTDSRTGLWGKCVAQERNVGKEGDYCHNHDQCASGFCLCPDNAYDGNSCKDWLKRNSPSEQGRCAVVLGLKSNGASCSRSDECESQHCADAWPWQKGKCAPIDGRGQVGDYCHHNNHCASGSCVCPGYKYDGAFCKDWTKFGTLTHGTCSLPAVKKSNGDYCSKNEECTSGYCADGKRCAPKDGTGVSGDYCHHNNQCRSKTCDCPKGTDWLGFCTGWEKLDWQKGQTGTCY